MLEGAINAFHQEYDRYPTSESGLEVLLDPEVSELNPRGLVFYDGNLKDPWGNPYQYRFPGIHSFLSFDVFSFGPDGTSNSLGNDLDDISSWKPHSDSDRFTMQDVTSFLLLLIVLVAFVWASATAIRARRQARMD